jgi:hypothetical protein
MGDGDGGSPLTMENLITLQKNDPEAYLELLRLLQLASEADESLRELKTKNGKER